MSSTWPQGWQLFQRSCRFIKSTQSPWHRYTLVSSWIFRQGPLSRDSAHLPVCSVEFSEVCWPQKQGTWFQQVRSYSHYPSTDSISSKPLRRPAHLSRYLLESFVFIVKIIFSCMQGSHLSDMLFVPHCQLLSTFYAVNLWYILFHWIFFLQNKLSHLSVNKYF